jgi:hypothetical protein
MMTIKAWKLVSGNGERLGGRHVVDSEEIISGVACARASTRLLITL